jgi:C-terminal processing protease CtpA/Prc
MNVSHAEKAELLTAVAAKIRAGYVWPERGETVAAKLEAHAADSGAIRYPQTNLSLFCEQLTADLQLWSDDNHLRVRYSKAPYVQPPDDTVAREQSDRRLHCQRIGFGVAKVEHLPHNVGYIDVREFVELSLARDIVNAAMTLVAKCDALIIDLRECVGGDPATVAWMASYLFDERVRLSTFEPRHAPREEFWTADLADVPGPRFGGMNPVFVLTSHYTFSGAEQFAYDLQALRRVKVVGEITGGGAHACSFYWITDHVNLLLPECRPVNPITNSNWEKSGVKPDALCSAQTALKRAQALVENSLIA